MKKLSVSLLITLTFVVPSFGYRDGAREESCYNHTVNHEGDVFFGDCVPSSCRYFLVIKEVVNETTLELGNVTDTYECGKIYGIEVANNLNAPEGFLVQARNGTSDSSEIIGTFLDPDVVRQRTGNTQVNYKILQCRRLESSAGQLYNNSATQPDYVNMAGTLQLFWQAPECNNDPCTEEDHPNVTVWFTIVQQLLIVFNPSKSTILTYRPPPFQRPTSCIVPVPSSLTYLSQTDTASSTAPYSTMHMLSIPKSASFSSSKLQVQCTPTPPPKISTQDASAQDCIITTSVAAIVCSFILFFGGVIAGSLVGHLLTVYRQRNRTINQDLAAPPFYEELPYQTTNPINPRNKTNIELETNAAYEIPDKTMKATPSSVPQIELETNAAYGHIKNL